MKVAIYNFEFNSDSGNILFHFSRGLFKKNIMPVCFYQKQYLKEVFAKSEKGYRLKSKNILWLLLIILQLLLSVASIRRKWLTRLIPNSQSCIIPDRWPPGVSAPNVSVWFQVAETPSGKKIVVISALYIKQIKYYEISTIYECVENYRWE